MQETSTFFFNPLFILQITTKNKILKIVQKGSPQLLASYSGPNSNQVNHPAAASQPQHISLATHIGRDAEFFQPDTEQPEKQ